MVGCPWPPCNAALDGPLALPSRAVAAAVRRHAPAVLVGAAAVLCAAQVTRRWARLRRLQAQSSHCCASVSSRAAARRSSCRTQTMPSSS